MFEKENRRWLISASIIILFFTSVPYLMGYFKQGTEWHFTGFLFGVEDGNSYIAKMLSGTYGSWLFKSPYTAIPQKGVLAFLPYIIMGKLAFPPEVHDQLVALFQIFRWVAGGLLIFSVYLFAGLFSANENQKRWASLVILLGGGLGWIGWMMLPETGAWRLPLEVYSPEAFGFLSILGLPHLAAARAFLLFGLFFYIKEEHRSSVVGDSVKGGLCWLTAGFFQPLAIVVGYGILAWHILLVFLINRNNRLKEFEKYLKKAIILGSISVPWVIYNFLFFQSDDYLRAWYTQNVIQSPPIWDYLWSFGLFLGASIPAVIWIIRNKREQQSILLAWVLSACSLAYFPYNVQRRFIDGIWIALVLLVFLSYELVQKNVWKNVIKILVGSTGAATLLVLMVILKGVWTLQMPVYRPAGEVQFFNTIIDRIKPGSIVLCSYETANTLPAWDPVFVLAGHGPESANLSTVLPEVKDFFSGQKDIEWQKNFIKQYSINFIISGPLEQKLGVWEQKYARHYTQVVEVNGYSVYRSEPINGE
ncbi:hypothetical protein [Leptolinea tardivitalis]|uniref:Glycosyltransferase RgtA/B/C/D-like domain-containing protein n=1 Tax=Leptolinea tardivitalis TaxID=229920 RepID=A0A0P6X045_9CHLR|nr:hypothetical protein [Leptolinea tardivitalis]KPL72552.1 hypothetical protein ADM99_05380 [Leptolinea tardivitalis]GAP21147.1 hypothetical protein LTAR_01354 [Leptolinea tardivitalis]